MSTTVQPLHASTVEAASTKLTGIAAYARYSTSVLHVHVTSATKTHRRVSTEALVTSMATPLGVAVRQTSPETFARSTDVSGSRA